MGIATGFAATYAIAHFLITGEPTSTGTLIVILAFVFYDIGQDNIANG
jgi:hypothetical protein